MPAKSKAQQRLFGIARAIQKGDRPASSASDPAKMIAKKVKKREVDKFAKTPTKGLPDRVKKEMKEAITELVFEILKEDIKETPCKSCGNPTYRVGGYCSRDCEKSGPKNESTINETPESKKHAFNQKLKTARANADPQKAYAQYKSQVKDQSKVKSYDEWYKTWNESVNEVDNNSDGKQKLLARLADIDKKLYTPGTKADVQNKIHAEERKIRWQLTNMERKKSGLKPLPWNESVKESQLARLQEKLGRQLTTPEKHELAIAYKTMKMPDAMVGVMGGMTKQQAKDTIKKLTGKEYQERTEALNGPMCQCQHPINKHNQSTGRCSWCSCEHMNPMTETVNESFNAEIYDERNIGKYSIIMLRKGNENRAAIFKKGDENKYNRNDPKTAEKLWVLAKKYAQKPITESSSSTFEKYENQVYKAQKDIIKKKYGEKVANQANYGWATDDTGCATKIYLSKTPIVLNTEVDASGKMKHSFEAYEQFDESKSVDAELDKEYKAEEFVRKQLDKKVSGMSIVNQLQQAPFNCDRDQAHQIYYRIFDARPKIGTKKESIGEGGEKFQCPKCSKLMTPDSKGMHKCSCGWKETEPVDEGFKIDAGVPVKEQYKINQDLPWLRKLIQKQVYHVGGVTVMLAFHPGRAILAINALATVNASHPVEDAPRHIEAALDGITGLKDTIFNLDKIAPHQEKQTGNTLQKLWLLPANKISKWGQQESVMESKASDEAKKLGLEYMGFGRYGKKGKQTHIVKNDKLVAVTPTSVTASKKDASTGSKMFQKPIATKIDKDSSHNQDAEDFWRDLFLKHNGKPPVSLVNKMAQSNPKLKRTLAGLSDPNQPGGAYIKKTKTGEYTWPEQMGN